MIRKRVIVKDNGHMVALNLRLSQVKFEPEGLWVYTTNTKTLYPWHEISEVRIEEVNVD